MFARVTIRATDGEASARFHDTVLATLARARSATEWDTARALPRRRRAGRHVRLEFRDGTVAEVV